MARQKRFYEGQQLVRYVGGGSSREYYRRPFARPGFHFFRDLPYEIFNQICCYTLQWKDRVNTARTKPPGFLYSCRYVWLQAFGFYYGNNHFVITIDHDSINAAATYLNMVLSKLNDPQQRAVVPQHEFAGKATTSFGSVHLIMQYCDANYNCVSFAKLERVWRHVLFLKHTSMTVFGAMVERMLEGCQTPCNSRVQDDFVIEWLGQQEQIRLRSLAAQCSDEERARLFQLGKEQNREILLKICDGYASSCPGPYVR